MSQKPSVFDVWQAARAAKRDPVRVDRMRDGRPYWLDTDEGASAADYPAFLEVSARYFFQVFTYSICRPLICDDETLGGYELHSSLDMRDYSRPEVEYPRSAVHYDCCGHYSRGDDRAVEVWESMHTPYEGDDTAPTLTWNVEGRAVYAANALDAAKEFVTGWYTGAEKRTHTVVVEGVSWGTARKTVVQVAPGARPVALP